MKGLGFLLLRDKSPSQKYRGSDHFAGHLDSFLFIWNIASALVKILLL